MVQNYQSADTISDPTIAKLLEVDSELAITEAHLLAQLESLREKRRSLKNVIDLFTQADTTTATPIAALAIAQSNGASTAIKPSNEFVATPESALPVTEVIVTSELEIEQKNATTDKTPLVDESESPQEKKTRSAIKTKQPAASNKTAITPELATTDPSEEPGSTQSPLAKTKQPAAALKTAKKTERWQDYLREEFSNSTLSEAVASVLQRQPEQVLEIAAVVDAIFVDKLPKQVRSTARERISNVLSDGVRKNKWYRSGAGSYSMSDSVVDEANSI